MDLNEDGHPDILSGSYSRMGGGGKPMAGLFQVLWGKGGGEFEAAKALAGTDGQELLIPYQGDSEITKGICTRPWAVDWDQDGDLDLVVGNFEGTFYLFLGEGKGRFTPKPEPIMTGGKPLKIKGVHSDPMMVDWDGDGDLDILSGSGSGGVQWAENVAGASAMPSLTPFSELIPAAGHHDSENILRFEDLRGPSSGTRVWAADVNGDNKLDLLVGDDTTLVSPASGLSEEEFKKAYDTWQEDYQKIGSPETDPEKERARRDKIQEIISRRDEFIQEDSTGFVWVYLRK